MSILLLTALSMLAADDVSQFQQDRFAIGFWVDPPADENMEAHYQDIADANFTLVLGAFGARTAADVQRQLELCVRHDLKALIGTSDFALADYPEDGACWGYMIRDEPEVADFPGLAQKAEAVRTAHPGKLGYINLFPNYASAAQLGAESYDDHVRQFMELVKPGVLSMDHYPQFKPDVDGRDGYCENLAVMRKYALMHDVPFWNFFNTMPYGPHTDPTEAQLRWQINASIAYGAKGVLYFCYWTPPGGEFPKGGAIIHRDGRKSRHYYEAQRINKALRNLGTTLMKLTSTGVYRVAPGDDPRQVLEGAPLVALDRASHDPEHDYLVGVYDHEDGGKAVLLMNYRFAYSAWPTVVFDRDAAEVLEVSPETGEAAPVIDDSPDMEGLQVALDAGGARLFLLP